MSSTIENAVLVELEYGEPANKVLRVIRSYLSHRRAQEDLELLRELHPGKAYDIQTVEHIDN